MQDETGGEKPKRPRGRPKGSTDKIPRKSQGKSAKKADPGPQSPPPSKMDAEIERGGGIVETMAGYRVPFDDIARVMKLSRAQLSEMYGEQLKNGQAKVNVNLAKCLYELAVGRDKQVRQVPKKEIKDGKVREYMGQETVHEARPPNVQVAIFLAKAWLGWREQNVPASGVPAATDPFNAPPEHLDYRALSDAELVQLKTLYAKMGFHPSADADQPGGYVAGGNNTSRH